MKLSTKCLAAACCCLLRLARHQHKHIGIIAVIDQRRGAITGPLMRAVRNMAAAAATNTAIPGLQLRPSGAEPVSLALLEALAYDHLPK